MKKKLLSAIVITIFTIAMAITSQALSIDYCNLSFSDSVYIKYAVQSDTPDVQLLVWKNAQENGVYAYGTQDATLESVTTENINGTDYYIFNYKNIAAKEMTDYVYACAYANGTLSEAKKYSVLTYAYNKMGNTGIADQALKPLLENMLSYGAAAQVYFNYKPDRLANAPFYQVETFNGYLAQDHFEKGLYLEGEQVTIMANAKNSEDVPFAAWKNSTGEIIATSAEYTLTVGTANETYTAVYSNTPIVTYSQGLEYATNDDGTCYVASLGECTDTDIIIPEKDPATNDTVIGIDSNAFNGEAITSVTIPATVEEIARRAFYNCSYLTDIYYHGTASDWDNITISAGNDVLDTATMHYLVIIEHTVTFVDYDGRVIKTEKVANGNSATAPNEPMRDNFVFAGWDKEFNNITSDLTVTATYTFNSTEPTLVVNNVSAVAGQQEVEVMLEIYNNPGIAGMVISVEYDTSVMSMVNAENGDALALTPVFPLPEDLDVGNTTFCWVGASSPAKDGTVLTLKFNIKDTAAEGNYPIKVTYGAGQIVDNNSVSLDVNLVDGNVII